MTRTTQPIAEPTLRCRVRDRAQRFAADSSGATAIEYALMTFIAIAIMLAISQLGGSVVAMYERVQAAFVN